MITPPPDPRTVEAVARLLHRERANAPREICGHSRLTDAEAEESWSYAPESGRERCRHNAREALAALSAAGYTLVPPGAGHLEEWGVRWWRDGHEPQDHWHYRKRDEAEGAVRECQAVFDDVLPGRRDIGAKLIRREVITTPAVVVGGDEEEEANRNG